MDGSVAPSSRVVDERAISGLIHDYAVHVDRYEPDLVAQLFTEDCQVDYGPGVGGPTQSGIVTGRDVLRDRLSVGLGQFSSTWHMVSNHRVEFVDADNAAGLAYVVAWHRFADPAEGPDAMVWGHYLDRYRRERQRWLICERRLEVACNLGFDVPWHPISRRAQGTPTLEEFDIHG